MNSFYYELPVRVHFGESCIGELTEVLGEYGPNVLLSYGGGSIKKNGIYDDMTAVLRKAGKNVFEFSGIMPNPTYAKAQEGAALIREHAIDVVLAVGGGSVLDCSKAAVWQAAMDEDLWEGQLQRGRFPENPIPLLAVLTAAGTGSEMNKEAVITNEELGIKESLYGSYPEHSFLRPSYTMSLPMKQFISGAFDSLSHCMETYFGGPRRIIVSDELNESVMRSIIRNLRLAIAHPEDLEPRSELIWDSSLAETGILKIGKQTDFQAHQIEHQLGAFTDCNHGFGLSAIHAEMYRRIYKGDVARFARFAREVFGIDPSDMTEDALALAGIDALEDFIREIGLPTHLSEIDITDEEILRKTAETCNLSEGCCTHLSREEIFELLKACM